jgi:hypothetical protein
MTKFYSIILLLAVAFMVTDGFAQGKKVESNNFTFNHSSSVIPPQVDQVMDLLYDQTANSSGNAYTSQDFETAFDAYDNQAADNFTATDDWNINQIVVAGQYSAAGPAVGFNIYFYTDNAGMPGTEVYNAPSQPYTYDGGTGMFTINLNTPAALTAGNYWVSVQCRMDFGTAGQWYWGSVIGSIGSVAKWQNPGGGFGTTCATWGDITSCISATETDLDFALYGTIGPPVGPGPATDPVPADGATGVDINQDISWTNPGGQTSLEVFWGTDPGSLSSIYSGAPISTFDPGVMNYNTNYYWRVDETDGTGTTTGPVWHFTTMPDPNLVTLFMDDFESGLGNFTVNTTGGCPWQIFTDPTITSRYTLPATAGGGILAADADHCGSSGGGSSGSVTLNSPLDASQYQSVAVEWDNDWFPIASSDFAYLDVSTDGGSNWMNVITFNYPGVRNTHEYYDISSMVALHSFILRLVSVQPGWDWWWAVDNLQVTAWDIVPVELSSFTANVSGGNVVLNWTTATETNNKGFEVQRSNGGEYQTISFVNGNGTSTQQHSYTYSDQNVENGNYSYRLRQVDFDGSSKYSQVVDVIVNSPVEFSLAQNYPNPFNPSTRINYSLKVDSKVTLKVFDILGQEVVTLLNGNIAAGNHNVTFDASKLNSGVYLYKIEANGVDGSKFISVKKMILTK